MPSSPNQSLDKNKDKIYTVSELNSLAGQTLEKNIGSVWVRGEVTGLKTQPSGHIYFTLKDAGSLINVALFKHHALRLGVKLAEGKQVLIFGQLDIYLPRGSYQLIAQFALEEGAGQLQQEFERLKKQLEAEGLFAASNKVPIPQLPATVAFISSPTGAVWQDFTEILSRRDWRGRVILFPSRVQGAEAPSEIISALQSAERHPDVELIIVARGGGSLEDLWSFNDERVVRAVAALQRPVISAVGHQTDFTLCDFAADLRAETPSAAAELIAGFFNDARATVESLTHRLFRTVGHALTLARQQLQEFSTRLRSRSPRVILTRHTQRIDELSEHLSRLAQHRLRLSSQRLDTLSARLKGLDPALTLQRGYAIVRNGTGHIVKKAKDLHASQEIKLTFADGDKKATTH